MGFGSIFGGGGSGKSKQTSSVTIPDWLAGAAKPLYTRAANIGTQISNQGYSKYGGQRVAGLNQGQQDAIRGIQGNVNNPMLGQSKKYVTDTLSGNNLKGNPYLDDMVGITKRGVTDTFNKTTMPQMQANLARQNAFGGSGWIQANQDMNNSLAQQLADAEMGMRFQNYGNERAYQDSASRQAADLSNQDLAGQQAALQAGGLQQALDQRQMDINNQDFEDERDWLFRALQGLGGGTGITEGVYGKSGTSKGGGGGGSGLAGIMGGAGQLMAGYGMASG
jgi:hypothetical protein